MVISIGVSYTEYWNLTIGEISDLCKYYNEQKMNQYRSDYNTALLTAKFISNSLNGEKIESFEELFPTEENTKVRIEMEMEKLKSQMTNFMVGHNNIRKGVN